MNTINHEQITSAIITLSDRTKNHISDNFIDISLAKKTEKRSCNCFKRSIAIDWICVVLNEKWLSFLCVCSFSDQMRAQIFDCMGWLWAHKLQICKNQLGYHGKFALETLACLMWLVKMFIFTKFYL